MGKMVKQTAFRFTDEDLRWLDACSKRTGVKNRSDVLRAAIRAYAQQLGTEPEEPAPRKRKGGR